MLQVRTIHETHLGGFYRFEVRTDGRVTLLTQGVTERDYERVLEHIAGAIDA